MAPFIRIALRYVAAILIARGFITPDEAYTIFNDPELIVGIEAVIGMAVAGVVEGWYWAARKLGWSK